MRKRGGGGGAGRGMGMLAGILGAPQENEFFGDAPGDVPYDMAVDPSKLVAQPYKPDNVWGHLNGSPATRANTAGVQDSMQAQQRFQQEVQMAIARAEAQAAVERAKMEAEFAAAQPGGLIEQQNAARYRSQIAGENMQRENAVSQLFPTMAGSYMDGPRAANAPSVVRGQISDLFNSYGQKNIVDQGLTGAMAGADKARADADSAMFSARTQPEAYDLWRQGEAATTSGKELANEEKLAGKPWWGSQQLGNSLLFPSGQFIGVNPAVEGKPSFGIPGKEGYIPGVAAQPASPFMGGMGGAFHIPGGGYFAPSARKAPVAEPGTTFLEPTPAGAKPMKAPKAPELRGSSILGEWGSNVSDFFSPGKRDGESWAEYEKRKKKR